MLIQEQKIELLKQWYAKEGLKKEQETTSPRAICILLNLRTAGNTKSFYIGFVLDTQN